MRVLLISNELTELSEYVMMFAVGGLIFSTSDRQSLSDVLLLSKVREIGHFQCISGRPRGKWEAESGRPRWEAEVLPWLAGTLWQIYLSQSGEHGLPLSASHLGLPPRPPTFGLPLSPRPPTFVMWSVWANQMCHKSLISCLGYDRSWILRLGVQI